MTGVQSTTVSPSSCSTRRSTPCVLGCCGPMLTVIVSLRSSGTARFSGLASRCSGLVARLRFARQSVAFDVLPEFFRCYLKRLSHLRRTTDLHRRILAQRETLPVFGHEKPPGIGM